MMQITQLSLVPATAMNRQEVLRPIWDEARVRDSSTNQAIYLYAETTARKSTAWRRRKER